MRNKHPLTAIIIASYVGVRLIWEAHAFLISMTPLYALLTIFVLLPLLTTISYAVYVPLESKILTWVLYVGFGVYLAAYLLLGLLEYPVLLELRIDHPQSLFIDLFTLFIVLLIFLYTFYLIATRQYLDVSMSKRRLFAVIILASYIGVRLTWEVYAFDITMSPFYAVFNISVLLPLLVTLNYAVYATPESKFLTWFLCGGFGIYLVGYLLLGLVHYPLLFTLRLDNPKSPFIDVFTLCIAISTFLYTFYLIKTGQYL